MRKQKAYSFINTIGLALGMTCSFLIFFWVQDELSYNRFHDKADRIFIVNKTYKIGSETEYNSSTPFPLARAIRENFAEVIDATRFHRTSALISFGESEENKDNVFNERRVCAVDPSYFEIFSFPFVKGGPAAVLEEPNAVVLTESIAAKYFETEDPIGKTLTFNHDKDFVIKGVIEDIPSNADFRYDLFVPASGIVSPDIIESWGDHYAITFVLLQEGAILEDLEEKLGY